MVAIKLGVLQFAPMHKDPLSGMAKADQILAAKLSDNVHQTAALHILVLPEMAFTGYQFSDRADIIALCEIAGEGATFEWAKRVALKYGCGVFVGFPRIDPETKKLYNSMLVVNPQGQLVTTYDKHHLFVTDKSWASEGIAFKALDLDWIKTTSAEHLATKDDADDTATSSYDAGTARNDTDATAVTGTTARGEAKTGPIDDVVRRREEGRGLRVCTSICMDINPYEFTADFEDYELATFCAQERVSLVLFSSAWCNRNPDDPPNTPIVSPDESETVNYWCARLRPLFGKKILFVAADRVGSEPSSWFRKGIEGDTTFCGSSCVIDVQEPKLLDMLDTTTEDLLVVEVNV